MLIPIPTVPYVPYRKLQTNRPMMFAAEQASRDMNLCIEGHALWGHWKTLRWFSPPIPFFGCVSFQPQKAQSCDVMCSPTITVVTPFARSRLKNSIWLKLPGRRPF